MNDNNLKNNVNFNNNVNSYSLPIWESVFKPQPKSLYWLLSTAYTVNP
jgi:hypothetical protein